MDLSLPTITILILQILCGVYGVYLMIGCIRGLLHERPVPKSNFNSLR